MTTCKLKPVWPVHKPAVTRILQALEELPGLANPPLQNHDRKVRPTSAREYTFPYFNVDRAGTTLLDELQRTRIDMGSERVQYSTSQYTGYAVSITFVEILTHTWILRPDA